MAERNILIIIPARGGSKGIPRKNLRALNGKPLIYYAIKNALGVNLPGIDCYVSSEDEEILVMANKFGAKTIKRRESMSGDLVTLDPVIYDAYRRVTELEQKQYEVVVTMQPTSPLINTHTLEKAILHFFSNDVHTLISGTYDSHLTWIKKDGKYFPNYEKRVNRQLLPEIYKETGGFVITKSQFVKENTRFGDKVEIFPVSKKEAIDIDDFDDWSLCEFYLKRKHILFVVSGNSEIGLGHVYNTLSIANEILNHKVTFLVDKGSDLAAEKISLTNFKVLKQNHTNLAQDILELAPDVVVNDILDTSEKYVSTLREAGIKIINFEDLGLGATYADLVINAMYPEGRMLTNHYFGAKYFILRDEFLFTADKVIKPEVSNVLISFGGVDPNNFTERILHLLKPFQASFNFKITAITGMGYKHTAALKKKHPDVTIKSNIKSMSDEILNADLIFTSAGRTTFEIASIGTPAIVLCQNKRETTHFFASEKNGFYNLGPGYEIDDETIKKAFHRSMGYDNRLLMNKRMLEHNLKLGKKRVLKLIRTTIEQ